MSSTPPPPYGGDDQSQGSSDPYGTPSQGQGDHSQGSPQQGGYSSTPSYGYGSDAGYQAAPGYYGGGAPNDRDNNFGVISLVTGIIGLFACQILGIVAIIYGRKAQAAQAAGTANNGTLGTVGFWLGVVSLAFLVIGIIIFVAVLSLGIMDASSSNSF
ncbi:DUF4190 domain-containing protein [Ornithinimicrobium sediminis]|uniref:DUF4190 domain-containing protein n=1 Tax=Ornithinimicrobium sediminis TaxID=2904603 RepID=UPI001E594119|nr:DUF4190 domain-containing protein [Ornithinimicrobium sediminis]MCE0485237.1 DUF4190 domain-containing protein [Ornithinimicrobium sediminis]